MVDPIEAPFTLFEKPIKVLLFDAVETPHVTLDLVSEIFNSINVIFLISKALCQLHHSPRTHTSSLHLFPQSDL